jgi:hypothetical protein
VNAMHDKRWTKKSHNDDPKRLSLSLKIWTPPHSASDMSLPLSLTISISLRIHVIPIVEKRSLRRHGRLVLLKLRGIVFWLSAHRSPDPRAGRVVELMGAHVVVVQVLRGHLVVAKAVLLVSGRLERERSRESIRARRTPCCKMGRCTTADGAVRRRFHGLGWRAI